MLAVIADSFSKWNGGNEYNIIMKDTKSDHI